MNKLVAVLVIGLLAACGSKAPATTTTTADNAGGEPPAAAPVATLISLENGDRACYVGLRLEDGTETSIEGSFDLCAGGDHDATALIGQKITYTTEKANVLAAECEGDMDCGKSDEVDLINSITAAP